MEKTIPAALPRAATEESLPQTSAHLEAGVLADKYQGKRELGTAAETPTRRDRAKAIQRVVLAANRRTGIDVRINPTASSGREGTRRLVSRPKERAPTVKPILSIESRSPNSLVSPDRKPAANTRMRESTAVKLA